MNRAAMGTYEKTTAGGETVRAFIPRPLPPRPALRLEGQLRDQLDDALIALIALIGLGRLDGSPVSSPT